MACEESDLTRRVQLKGQSGTGSKIRSAAKLWAADRRLSLFFFFLNILLSLMIFNWVQFIVCNYALISLSVFKNSSMHVMVVSGAKVTESHLTGVGGFASKWDKTKLLMWILK